MVNRPSFQARLALALSVLAAVLSIVSILLLPGCGGDTLFLALTDPTTGAYDADGNVLADAAGDQATPSPDRFVVQPDTGLPVDRPVVVDAGPDAAVDGGFTPDVDQSEAGTDVPVTTTDVQDAGVPTDQPIVPVDTGVDVPVVPVDMPVVTDTGFDSGSDVPVVTPDVPVVTDRGVDTGVDVPVVTPDVPVVVDTGVDVPVITPDVPPPAAIVLEYCPNIGMGVSIPSDGFLPTLMVSFSGEARVRDCFTASFTRDGRECKRCTYQTATPVQAASAAVSVTVGNGCGDECPSTWPAYLRVIVNGVSRPVTLEAPNVCAAQGHDRVQCLRATLR